MKKIIIPAIITTFFAQGCSHLTLDKEVMRIGDETIQTGREARNQKPALGFLTANKGKESVVFAFSLNDSTLQHIEIYNENGKKVEYNDGPILDRAKQKLQKYFEKIQAKKLEDQKNEQSNYFHLLK